MSTTIAGHALTEAQTRTLDLALDYMRKNAGDSTWGPHVSPRGDGRFVSPREIFPHANNQNTAHVRNLKRLWNAGVLRACEIEVTPQGMMRGAPLSQIAMKGTD